MWIFTEKGFLSAVAYDPTLDSGKRSRRQVKSWGKRPVLVRGRVEAHLEQLKPFWSKLRIEKDDSADYEFRAIMPRQRWNDFLMTMGDNIDYDSHFKEVVRKRAPGTKAESDALYSAMLSIWSTMAKLQPDAPYSGWKGSYQTSGWDWEEYWNKYGRNYSGYSPSGVKSAAASAAVFSGKAGSSLPQDSDRYTFLRHDGQDYTYDSEKKSWVEVGGPWPQDAKEDSADFETTDDVESMAKQLMLHAPGEVVVDDFNSSSAAYNLWCRATEEFATPLDPEDVMTLMEELSEAPDCPRQDADEYEALLHKMYTASYGTLASEFDLREQKERADLRNDSWSEGLPIQTLDLSV